MTAATHTSAMNPITNRSASIDMCSPRLHAVSRLRARAEQPDTGVYEAHPDGLPPGAHEP
jgi:hypothetical protein